MAKRTVEERLDRVEKRYKSLKAEVQDLWDRVNEDGNAHSQMEDETRDIAERARRAANRVSKQLKELMDEGD
jgi:chromosome segregation ATPase